MIEFAILGLLSWRPLAGYDLKKIISASELFYWSGNNNQIYRALIQLHKDGAVTQAVQNQESLPAKKIYTITASGHAKLREGILARPELPEIQHHFLIQLAWADELSPAELDALLVQYEKEVEARLAMQQETARRKVLAPNRSPRETYLWEEISNNLIATVQNELDWVRRVRKTLNEKEKTEWPLRLN